MTKNKEMLLNLNGKGSIEDYEIAIKALEEELEETERLKAKKKEYENMISERKREGEQRKKAEEKLKFERLQKEKANLILTIDSLERKAELYKAKSDIDDCFTEISIHKERIAEIDFEIGTKEVAKAIAAEEIEVEEKMGFWERLLSNTGTLIVAVIFFVFATWFSHHQVEEIGREINALNKVAQDSGDISQMLPPSISKMSFQKLWFSWLTIFTSLLGAVGIMGVIAPAQLIFMLPFTKNPVRKWKHFFEQSEEQKQWQSFAYFAATSLFLALCHAVGSM